MDMAAEVERRKQMEGGDEDDQENDYV